MPFRTNEEGKVVEVSERVLTDEEVQNVVSELDQKVAEGEARKAELEGQLEQVTGELEEARNSRSQFPVASATDAETDGGNEEEVSESVEEQSEEVQF